MYVTDAAYYDNRIKRVAKPDGNVLREARRRASTCSLGFNPLRP